MLEYSSIIHHFRVGNGKDAEKKSFFSPAKRGLKRLFERRLAAFHADLLMPYGDDRAGDENGRVRSNDDTDDHNQYEIVDGGDSRKVHA